MVKNQLIKRVKLSGLKFSLIVLVHCFSADMTATACAKIVKINPKTADRYYQYFRQLVLEYQEGERSAEKTFLVISERNLSGGLTNVIK